MTPHDRPRPAAPSVNPSSRLQCPAAALTTLLALLLVAALLALALVRLEPPGQPARLALASRRLRLLPLPARPEPRGRRLSHAPSRSPATCASSPRSPAASAPIRWRAASTTSPPSPGSRGPTAHHPRRLARRQAAAANAAELQPADRGDARAPQRRARAGRQRGGAARRPHARAADRLYPPGAGQGVRQPVSTAEPWHVWLAHPELAQAVDYITIHLLPYWEGLPVE